jgi:PilZ domain-containing protein
MAAADSPRERRSTSRLSLNGEVVARMQNGTVIPVVDLSLAGALIEVHTALRPGSVHPLRLQLGPREEITLQARVVRSFIHRFDNQTRGEAIVLYRVAVEFGDVQGAERAAMERRLSSLRYTPVDGDDFDTELGD